MSATLQEPTTTPSALPTSSTPNWLRTMKAALIVQGGYFALFGVWPLMDIDSFQAVTGPKTDLWLVRTVGVLITVIGAVLLFAVRQESPPAEIVVLAMGAAAGLMVVDLVIVFTRTASPIYLLDAGIEAALIGWWVTLLKPPSPRVLRVPSPGRPA